MSFLGAAAGAIGKAGLDFGMGVAQSAYDYKLTRKLRRREYQDMVHSMKAAGLNPILATGATPGHSAVSMKPYDVDISGMMDSASKAKEAAVRESTISLLLRPVS